MNEIYVAKEIGSKNSSILGVYTYWDGAADLCIDWLGRRIKEESPLAIKRQYMISEYILNEESSLKETNFLEYDLDENGDPINIKWATW
jgi:hypothetical protein